MNKFRVTCWLYPEECRTLEKKKRVFATSKKFATREEAAAYADTVADSREAAVVWCDVETEKTASGQWLASGERAPRDMLVVGNFTEEIDAVNEWIEEAGLCTVSFYGLHCGGKYDVPDEAGSGYMRCNRCSML